MAQSSAEHDRPKLNLNVTVSDTGFIIAGSGGVLYENDVKGKLPTIPKRGKEYDYARLTKTIMRLKSTFPDENVAILGANPGIPYETVVRTMDAVLDLNDQRRQRVFFALVFRIPGGIEETVGLFAIPGRKRKVHRFGQVLRSDSGSGRLVNFLEIATRHLVDRLLRAGRRAAKVNRIT